MIERKNRMQKKADPSNPYSEPFTRSLEGIGLIHPSTKFGSNIRLGEGVIIEEGCKIGDNTFIGHYTVIRPNTLIGNDCVIGHLTVFEGDATIGNRVLIHAQCHITKGVTIEDDVFIAPLFCGANTPRIVHGRDYSLILRPYHIKRAARIGISVSILPGITIGENAQIGAGSVVTKDVPDRECWFGNPAYFKKMVPDEEFLGET